MVKNLVYLSEMSSKYALPLWLNPTPLSCVDCFDFCQSWQKSTLLTMEIPMIPCQWSRLKEEVTGHTALPGRERVVLQLPSFEWSKLCKYSAKGLLETTFLRRALKERTWLKPRQTMEELLTGVHWGVEGTASCCGPSSWPNYTYHSNISSSDYLHIAHTSWVVL